MNDEQFPCRTLDLSAHGVSLVSQADLKPGSPVRVELLLDSGDRWISVNAMLVRIERLNGLFFWGVRFDAQDEKVKLLNPLLYPDEDDIDFVAC
jgi:hypothetical protein